MELIRFLTDFFSIDGAGNSFIKYLKGKLYPANAETASQVAAGTAEVVTVAPDTVLAADHPPAPDAVVTDAPTPDAAATPADAQAVPADAVPAST